MFAKLIHDRVAFQGIVDKAVACDVNHPKFSQFQGSVGVLYQSRFQEYGNVSDLEEAIIFKKIAIVTSPNKDTNLANLYQSLASTYRSAYELTKLAGMLDIAIQYGKDAIDLMTILNHTDLAICHDILADSYMKRSHHLHEMNDLYLALNHMKEGIKLTSSEDLLLPARYRSISAAYHTRFILLVNDRDLRRANYYKEMAQQLTPRNYQGSKIGSNKLEGERYRQIVKNHHTWTMAKDISDDDKPLPLAKHPTATLNDGHLGGLDLGPVYTLQNTLSKSISIPQNTPGKLVKVIGVLPSHRNLQAFFFKQQRPSLCFSRFPAPDPGNKISAQEGCLGRTLGSLYLLPHNRTYRPNGNSGDLYPADRQTDYEALYQVLLHIKNRKKSNVYHKDWAGGQIGFNETTELATLYPDMCASHTSFYLSKQIPGSSKHGCQNYNLGTIARITIPFDSLCRVFNF